MPRKPRRPGTVHRLRPPEPEPEPEPEPAQRSQLGGAPGVEAARTLRSALRPTNHGQEELELEQQEDDGQAGDSTTEDATPPQSDRDDGGGSSDGQWAGATPEEEEVYRLAQLYGVATVAPASLPPRRPPGGHEQRPTLDTQLPAYDPSRVTPVKRRRKRRVKKKKKEAAGTRVRGAGRAAAAQPSGVRGPSLDHRITGTLEKVSAMARRVPSLLEWGIFLQLEGPGGSSGKARRRQAETGNDRLAEGAMLPADSFMALIEADGATYAAAVKELVHNTQDSLRSLGIAGADREAIRGAIERSLGGEPTPAEVHRAAMACNNAGCLQVRKGNAKEAVFHFRKIVILSRFVAVRLANPKSITISDNSLEYFQQQREQRRGGSSRTALVKHLENGARRRLSGEDTPESEHSRRDEAIIRLNLTGALRSMRTFKAAFTQAQTALTLLLHDHADSPASGALLSLAHFYVGTLKQEQEQEQDWLAMQNRATCSQVLESLLLSIEVSRTWSSSNAITRCFEAHAKAVLERLDACEPDEEAPPYDEPIPVLPSPSPSADAPPHLHMMHLRTPSPAKGSSLQWTREWKGGVGRLNSRDSLFDTLRSENIQSAMDSIPRETGTGTTLPSIPRDRPTSESGSAHDGTTSPSLGGRLAARYAVSAETPEKGEQGQALFPLRTPISTPSILRDSSTPSALRGFDALGQSLRSVDFDLGGSRTQVIPRWDESR